MVTSQQAPVDVTSDVWTRALKRARARGYEMEFVKEVWVRGYAYKVWRVASSSEPGSYHYVSLTRMSTGWAVSCDCKAGEHDKPCVHAALALRDTGVLCDPDPIMVQAA